MHTWIGELMRAVLHPHLLDQLLEAINEWILVTCARRCIRIISIMTVCDVYDNLRNSPRLTFDIYCTLTLVNGRIANIIRKRYLNEPDTRRIDLNIRFLVSNFSLCHVQRYSGQLMAGITASKDFRRSKGIPEVRGRLFAVCY